MDLGAAGRLLLILGVLVAAVGGFLMLGGRLPFGRLPGDVAITGGGNGLYIPIVSCIVISVVLTIVLNIVLRG